MTLSAMARLSAMKPTGLALLKAMPPTLAAATITASGGRAYPLLGLRLAGEVERCAIRRKDCASLRFESAHESGANHTSVPCDVNALGGEVEQRRLCGISR